MTSIWLWSRSLNVHERNHSVSDEGSLAVIWAITTLHFYDMEVHFTVYTDHSLLRLLINISDP